jgi:hypothetical protein
MVIGQQPLSRRLHYPNTGEIHGPQASKTVRRVHRRRADTLLLLLLLLVAVLLLVIRLQ